MRNRNLAFTLITMAAVGAMATAAAIRRQRMPSTENVLRNCSSALEELEHRLDKARQVGKTQAA